MVNMKNDSNIKRSNASKKEKRISVRLSPKSSEKLDSAVKKGYCISDYINLLISEAPVVNINDSRGIMQCVCHLESLAEEIEDKEIQNEMREELWGICQFLK